MNEPQRKPHNTTLGARGEEIAAIYLERECDWIILDRNWRCRDGEIDIIAYDDEDVVFVEVKTRSSAFSGDPLEAVDFHKLRTLQGLATRWVTEQKGYIPSYRIDVIGICFGGEAPTLTHIEQVFHDW